MERLSRITLSGYKTIRNLENFELKNLNVLIGANGAGKSNFISFFRMMNWMTGGSLQEHVGRAGGAGSLLFDGPKTTQQIEANLEFETDQGRNEYNFRLAHAGMDTCIFSEEKFRFSRTGRPVPPQWSDLGAGHREPGILDQDDATARFIKTLLLRCTVYQFHDTSDEARIKQKWNVADNSYLKNDGANLAPYLLYLSNEHPQAYRRIVDTIRLIMPFFQDFYLEPENHSIILRWREKGSDLVFGPHMASDGGLRTMALITLLLQPEDRLPAVIILDEPELGLHPYAINIVAGLIKKVSRQKQAILATQSMTLLDYFEPEDVVVVTRRDRESVFQRLESDKLKEWREEYSIAELWEKNVLGGRP